MATEKGKKKNSILIIDDDPNVRLIVAETLKEYFNVVEASNGQEGIFKYRNQKFDLIICDLTMPKRNGIELLTEVREYEERNGVKKCPALIISGFLQDHLREISTIELVFTMEKPFDAEDIVTKIKSVFFEIAQEQKAKNAITLKKGDVLIEEGKRENRVFLVTGGKLGVFKSKEGGGEIFLAEIETYEIVGEMSFFLESARTCTVRALEDSVVKIIPGKLFIETLESLPVWFRSIMSTYAKRITGLNERIIELEAKK